MARPTETTEILQKCVSLWQRHSQSFISSRYDRPITQNSFQGHYSACGGCFSDKQMLTLLNVLSLQLSLWQQSIKASFRKRKCKRSQKVDTSGFLKAQVDQAQATHSKLASHL